MTEPIFYTLLLLNTYFFTKFIKTFKTKEFKTSTIFFLALFLAITFLQRYVGIFAIFSVTVLSILYFFSLNKFKEKNLKKKISTLYKNRFVITIVLILIIFAILVSPYILRNYALFNSFISPEFSGQTDLISKCRGMQRPINHMIRYMVNQDIPCSINNVIYSTLYQIYHFFTNILTIFLFISSIILLYLRKTFKLRIRTYFDFTILIFYLLSIFFTIRSHYEPRYFTPIFILLIPLIMYTLLRYYKKSKSKIINTIKTLINKYSYITIIIISILIILLSFYSTYLINHRLSTLPSYQNYSPEADWILQNTQEQDIIMTSIPAHVNFYTSRKAVMLPDNDLQTINNIINKYNVDYIILNKNKFNDKTNNFLYLDKITESDFNSIGFFKVYDNKQKNIVAFTNQSHLVPTYQT
tara:strand:- start:192 stop:1427 length:1236 start_codon:yes stop_codon:yes gene_type:complete